MQSLPTLLCPLCPLCPLWLLANSSLRRGQVPRRSKPFRTLASVLAAAFLVVACGRGGEVVEPDNFGPDPLLEAPVLPGVLAVDMPDCDRVAVHDSGHVVYVVPDRTCAGGGPRRGFSLGVRRGAESTGDAVQLDMQEGDEFEGITIPGLGMRRVGLYRAGQWRRIDNTASWQHRDGAGLLLLDGELYLLGGWLWGPVTSEVWKTRDLVNWQYLGDAPWPARHGSAWLVHDRRLWVIGGDLYDDVWSSADGVRSTQEASAAPFGKRSAAGRFSGDCYAESARIRGHVSATRVAIGSFHDAR